MTVTTSLILIGVLLALALLSFLVGKALKAKEKHELPYLLALVFLVISFAEVASMVHAVQTSGA